MIKGFKDFISRGNAVDLAVGVIIGAAFKPIIDALTDKILLRLISAIFGKPSFNEVGTFYIGTTPIEPAFSSPPSSTSSSWPRPSTSVSSCQ